MSLEGKILGNRYEIIKKIGTGGMAVVYKAKCQMLNRFVAIKVLKEEFTQDIEFVTRFEVEAQAAASLSHPNIVSIYDVGKEGRIHYIVMELVEGKTLKDIILEDGAVSWKWSVNIVAQIASALEVAHKNHIIHRDIKPHNIIITEDGIAKVTDFGIAKAVSNSTITAFGKTIGSVHYFSPEQARGGHTDEKTDIYSLGVVLYELVTGKVPFDSDTPVSIALKHMQDKPVPPMETNISIPKGVNDIILKAMQKDPDCRYSSATLMLLDLQFALKNPDLDFVQIGQTSTSQDTTEVSKVTPREKKSRLKEEPEKKGLKQLFKRSKSFRVTVYIISAIVLFVLAFSGMYFLFGTTSKDIEVPNLIGVSQAEAETMTKQSKLKIEVIEEVYDENVPSGYITFQTPTPPMKLKQNKGVIQVKVSKGAKSIELIDVTKMNFEAAKNKLIELGLEVEEKREYSTKVEKDIVISQSPEAKKTVDGGSKVILTVSNGEEKKLATMPELVGKSEEEAKKLISDNKLLLKSPIEYIQDESKKDGEVIKQSIVAGNIIEEMTVISITVNKLPKASKGTIIINLSQYIKNSDSAQNTENTEAGGTNKPEQEVNLKVVIDGEKACINGTTGKKTYEESRKPSDGKLSIAVEGFGTISIKVYVNGVEKTSTTMNLESVTSKEIIVSK